MLATYRVKSLENKMKNKFAMRTFIFIPSTVSFLVISNSKSSN